MAQSRILGQQRSPWRRYDGEGARIWELPRSGGLPTLLLVAGLGLRVSPNPKP